MRNFIKVFVNFLTTLRLLSIIILMFLFQYVSKGLFLFFIVILYLTDFIDGKMARYWKVQTVYGSNMDTIADKFLSIGLILLIVSRISIMWLLLVGEILIAFINVTGKLQGKKTKSSGVGKLKTWLIAIATILCYANYFNIVGKNFVYVSCFITFFCQLYCFVFYIIYLRKQKESIIKSVNNKNEESLLYRLFSTEYYFKTEKK